MATNASGFVILQFIWMVINNSRFGSYFNTVQIAINKSRFGIRSHQDFNYLKNFENCSRPSQQPSSAKSKIDVSLTRVSRMPL